MRNVVFVCFLFVFSAVHAQKKLPAEKLKTELSKALQVYFIDSTTDKDHPKRIIPPLIPVTAATGIKQLKLSSSSYKILGFVLVMVNSNHDTYIAHNLTGVLGKEALDMINRASKGETIVFDEIRATDKKNNLVTLMPYALKVE
jgi:hypothetical protein